MQRSRRADLMQGPAGKAARERLIERRNAEADRTAPIARRGGDIRNGAAECMQGRLRCGGHFALLRVREVGTP